MTGEELRTKAINGARGVVGWGKLSASEKGMWNNAVREIQHEKDKLLVRVTLHERESIIAFLRDKCAALRGDPALGLSDMMIGMLAFGEDLARMLERGEHT
ncbi:MAG: hypothetical protein V3W41_12890 [Planctomycetota bacterium]